MVSYNKQESIIHEVVNILSVITDTGIECQVQVVDELANHSQLY